MKDDVLGGRYLIAATSARNQRHSVERRSLPTSGETPAIKKHHQERQRSATALISVACPVDRLSASCAVVSLLQSSRPAIEVAVHMLIDRLDVIDGDVDLELEVDRCDANDDDPTSIPGSRIRASDLGDADDAEDEGENEPECDAV